MDTINITTPGFSLDNVDNIISDSITDIINDNSDYSIFIYISIFLLIIMIFIVIYYYNYNTKNVRFNEDNNEYYNNK